ncbi:nuclear transport factor 2 family protein [Marinomonas sp. MED121]|uniref:nuclear transport factor 2 family protein n=1 Tax=Marinomonas sp. MED121 TaxID=314277 RepID=UPI0003040C5D|nr:nuclear transport factor 2 family protein [Marinomonas sp. MED121]
MSQENLEKWHQVVHNKDMSLLRELLAEDVEFHSPTLWAPKKGRDITQYILKMVLDIFEDFEYQRQWVDENNLALEFSARVDDKKIKGIDLIRWNEQGQIVHFEVMLRPMNGLQLMFDKMTAHLQAAGFLPKS